MIQERRKCSTAVARTRFFLANGDTLQLVKPISWSVVGLSKCRYQHEAQRLSYRWLHMLTTGFVEAGGCVPEKFNAVEGTSNIDAEYGNQGTDFHLIPREGFGWTNSSYQVGLSFLTQFQRRALGALTPPESFFLKGPSAGIAILIAFISLFIKRGVSSELAMTGEVTLAGQVLPVGGLREKILAAHRAGIKRLLLPMGCKADVEPNVHNSVKEGISIVYVENVGEVIKEAFAGQPVADKVDALRDILLPREESRQ
ncbi:hypothetical protein JCM6882_002495 [Rhodosporidiobolus microsporus]